MKYFTNSSHSFTSVTEKMRSWAQRYLSSVKINTIIRSYLLRIWRGNSARKRKGNWTFRDTYIINILLHLKSLKQITVEILHYELGLFLLFCFFLQCCYKTIQSLGLYWQNRLLIMQTSNKTWLTDSWQFMFRPKGTVRRWTFWDSCLLKETWCCSITKKELEKDGIVTSRYRAVS